MICHAYTLSKARRQRGIIWFMAFSPFGKLLGPRPQFNPDSGFHQRILLQLTDTADDFYAGLILLAFILFTGENFQPGFFH